MADRVTEAVRGIPRRPRVRGSATGAPISRAISAVSIPPDSSARSHDLRSGRRPSSANGWPPARSHEPAVKNSSHVFEEHTADVRLRVEAPTLPELFVEAGRALAELVGPEEGARGPILEEETVYVRASDRDALLVDWLNELVYRSETTKRVYPELAIESFSQHELEARIRGFDAEDLRTPVKAATFHGLRITERPGGYTASVVLDV